MDASFPLFPLLPPEIRLAIWHLVFTTNWSFTGFTTRQDASAQYSYTGGAALLGRVARTAAASCREARAAMLRVYEPTAFGPVDFPRHIFYLRGLFNLVLQLMKDEQEQGGGDPERDAAALVLGQVGGVADVVARAQHVVLPMDSLVPERADKIRMELSVLRDQFVSLRSLVIVCDRHMMAEHERDRGRRSRNAAGPEEEQQQEQQQEEEQQEEQEQQEHNEHEEEESEEEESEEEESEEEEEEEEDPWCSDGPRDTWLDLASSVALFETSPREVDISQLAQDLEGEHTASRALALAKEWFGRRRPPIGLPSGRWRGLGRRYATVGDVLALVKEVVSEMPSRPRLYLRLRHELPRFDEPELPSRC